MQDNLKPLLKYLYDSFWDQLVNFQDLACVKALKVKYEQVSMLFCNSIYLFALLYNLKVYVSDKCIHSRWRIVRQKVPLMQLTVVGNELMSVLWRKRRKTTSMRTGMYFDF